MNIIIYGLILILSLLFVFLGYLLQDNAQIFKFVGFGFLFILSVMLIPGTPGELQYKTGVQIETTDNVTTETDIYTSYEDFTIGFFLTIAAVFGFVNSYFGLKAAGGITHE